MLLLLLLSVLVLVLMLVLLLLLVLVLLLVLLLLPPMLSDACSPGLCLASWILSRGDHWRTC